MPFLANRHSAFWNRAREPRRICSKMPTAGAHATVRKRMKETMRVAIATDVSSEPWLRRPYGEQRFNAISSHFKLTPRWKSANVAAYQDWEPQ